MRLRHTGHAGRLSCAKRAKRQVLQRVCPQGATRGRTSSERQTGQSRDAGEAQGASGAGSGRTVVGTDRVASWERRRRRRVRAWPRVAPRAKRPKEAAAVSRLPRFPIAEWAGRDVEDAGAEGGGATGICCWRWWQQTSVCCARTEDG